MDYTTEDVEDFAISELCKDYNCTTRVCVSTCIQQAMNENKITKKQAKKLTKELSDDNNLGVNTRKILSDTSSLTPSDEVVLVSLIVGSGVILIILILIAVITICNFKHKTNRRTLTSKTPQFSHILNRVNNLGIMVPNSKGEYN